MPRWYNILAGQAQSVRERALVKVLVPSQALEDLMEAERGHHIHAAGKFCFGRCPLHSSWLSMKKSIDPCLRKREPCGLCTAAAREQGGRGLHKLHGSLSEGKNFKVEIDQALQKCGMLP